MYGEFGYIQSDYLQYAHFVSMEIEVLHHLDTPAQKMCSAHLYATK